MKSVFMNKSAVPTSEDLEHSLGNTFEVWKNLEAFTKEQYENYTAEWHFSGEKFGWSYRIKDQKRVIIYLLPRDTFFKVAFVFGNKSFEQILKSNVADFIKTELSAAKQYAEGRGIRIAIKDNAIMEDIQKLILIKLSN